MTVSIIIPTFNRELLLARLLSRLEKDRELAEVVVVDDGSTDDTGRMVQSTYPWVRYERIGGLGQPRAKRAGIEQAIGDIVTFFDDDALPEPGWLHPVLEQFAAGERIVQSKVVFLDRGQTRVDRDNGSVARLGWNLRWYASWNRGATPVSIPFCQETGGFIHREVLARVPFFDPNLIGDGVGESISFSLRARERGWRILFEPRSVIFHHGAAAGGSKERVKKRTLSSGASEFAQIYVHNLVYLNRRFNRNRLPLVLGYLACLAGGLSLWRRQDYVRYVWAGVRDALRTPIAIEAGRGGEEDP